MVQRSIRVFITAVLCAATMTLGAQAPKTHRLEATPTTVSYGHYWADMKPALTIDSGDIIDVDTMLTNTPDRLEKSGVPASEIQASLRAIVEQSRSRSAVYDVLTNGTKVSIEVDTK